MSNSFFLEKIWENDVDNVLGASAWALLSMTLSAARHSPGQLALGRSMIIQLQPNVGWNDLLQCEKEVMTKANAHENKARISHEHKVGDKVFIIHDKNSFMRPRKLSASRK